MDRQALIELFEKLDDTEAGWAIETLKAGNGELTLDEYMDVADCACKINDHDQLKAKFKDTLLKLESDLINEISRLRANKGIGGIRTNIDNSELEKHKAREKRFAKNVLLPAVFVFGATSLFAYLFDLGSLKILLGAFGISLGFYIAYNVNID